MQFLQDYPWLLAGAIFLLRLTDVSLGTLRMIMLVRGFRAAGSIVAFVEVLLWVVAVGQVLQNLDQWYLALAYAAGYATGNYVGMWLESRLALGTELVRAISPDPGVRLAEHLGEAGYHVAEVPGRSGGAPIEILLVIERRRRVPELLRLIEERDPDAICTLSDVRHAPTTPRARKRFQGLRLRK